MLYFNDKANKKYIWITKTFDLIHLSQTWLPLCLSCLSLSLFLFNPTISHVSQHNHPSPSLLTHTQTHTPSSSPTHIWLKPKQTAPPLPHPLHTSLLCYLHDFCWICTATCLLYSLCQQFHCRWENASFIAFSVCLREDISTTSHWTFDLWNNGMGGIFNYALNFSQTDIE